MKSARRARRANTPRAVRTDARVVARAAHVVAVAVRARRVRNACDETPEKKGRNECASGTSDFKGRAAARASHGACQRLPHRLQWPEKNLRISENFSPDRPT
jgi:hypothetical protein